MKVNVKHFVEIVGGVVVGSLAAEAVDKIIEVAKKQVKKAQKKEA